MTLPYENPEQECMLQRLTTADIILLVFFTAAVLFVI